ncbi:MAG: tRNA (adenosine(37)-N6)-threonylcarbamoyltransferase complex transferase subunit TsaD [Parachlamydiales bacterium]
MIVLGIESTCDETAAAVVVDGKEILSNVIASQAKLHEKYGGVMPELASREHLTQIGPVIEQALSEAGVTRDELDLIAAAQGPGLVGAIMVGLNTAKGMALGLGIPLIGVNHVEAHLYAAVMSAVEIPYPALGVVISGGHTSLLRVDGIGQYTLLGSTVDDAIGEAFDKVAAMLGLPYPGGPEVEKLARQGNPLPFKPGRVKERPLDFSFSGLKTQVLYAIKENPNKADVAAGFQETALQDLVDHVTLAAESFPCRAILLGGGVSQNGRLRELLQGAGLGLPLFWPGKGLVLDNAAMIAGLGYHRLQIEGPSPLDIPPKPRLAAFLS